MEIPQMLLIGSTGRNSGKTTLAAGFVHKWKGSFPIVGLKVTPIGRNDGQCPRGEQGCGVCSEFTGDYELIEETDGHTGKDTSVLLGAGCEKVYWLKTLRPHLAEGLRRFLTLMPEGALIVCESNSLREVAVPGVFIVLDNAGEGGAKESALKVLDKADIVVKGDIRDHLDRLLESLDIDGASNNLKVRRSRTS